MYRDERMPLVSIVLPVFNGERYLRASIDSVLGQTLTEWELIIVDDCSTDSTAEIADMYAKMDQRIRVIHNETNQRLPKSLNIGFQEARGDYLTWTSDDNMYLPEALEKMVAFLAEHNEYAMVTARMTNIDANGCFLFKSEGYDSKKIFSGNNVGACFMYRRFVRDKLVGYDDEHVYVEDYEYWLRVLKLCGPIGSIQEILYVYRLHAASLTDTKKEDIARHLEIMRYKHLEDIVRGLKGDIMSLHNIYDKFLRNRKFDITKVQAVMQDALPGIEKERFDFPSGRYVIFGAGDFGSRMRKILGGEAKCFVDNDEGKVGNLKDGRRIVSFAEMLEKIKLGYLLIIAVNVPYMYDIIKQVTEAGVNEYRTFLGYVRCNNIK